MGKNVYLRKLFCKVLLTFALLCILNIQSGMELAAAADTGEFTATDLERIKPGTVAPDFNLESVDKAWLKLSNYQNQKNVILVFYRGYW